MAIRIALLADHPEVLPELAIALEREWPDWYASGHDASAELWERSRSNGLPMGLVAMTDGRGIGTLAIADRATPSHSHLTPWIAGLWVEAARRNRGLGARLVRAACTVAREQGYDDLYAATITASKLFLREGWRKIDIGTTEQGETVEIFSAKLV